jgi:ABC-type multidrug transport system ATPase subunit
VIELKGVSASYRKVPAIQDVTLTVGEGEAVGLLGANGAGKSTTLRAGSRCSPAAPDHGAGHRPCSGRAPGVS